MNPKRKNRIENNRNNYNTLDVSMFGLLHAIPLLAFFTNVTPFDWVLCVFFYFFRMFWITGGYHRYFSHRSYKTSRWFQFVIAWCSQTSLQKGVLWWGAIHRIHHKHSDDYSDPHSNKLYGFFYSHIGWVFSPIFKKTKVNLIADFAKFKELRWLNKNHAVPPIALAIAIYIVGCFVNAPEQATTTTFLYSGLSTLLVGFFLSTIILYHGTYSINSLMHMMGKKRYKNTGDESRNHWLLALITLGEGWHNNHHHYAHSTRQGFFWWEIDITFYILKILSWFGLVWDLNPVPHKYKYSHIEKK